MAAAKRRKEAAAASTMQAASGLWLLPAGDVFADEVELEVHLIACTEIRHGGMGKRIRYDRDGKSIRADIEDREADAVEGDGAFFDHQAGKAGGEGDPELAAAVPVFGVPADACSIHVTLHEVTVQSLSQSQGSLQVDAVPCPEVSEIGFGERLRHRCDLVA